jgi:hypothetical protein
MQSIEHLCGAPQRRRNTLITKRQATYRSLQNMVVDKEEGVETWPNTANRRDSMTACCILAATTTSPHPSCLITFLNRI